MSLSLNLPVRNLICLRDPCFKKHEWHAGHLSRIKVSSPKDDYEIRQRQKVAGKEAYSIIRDMEHYYKMQLSLLQKHALYSFIKGALFSKF